MKTPIIFGRTTHCAVCYSIATNWNGWLRKSRDGVIAGFCDEHKPEENPNTKYTYGQHNYRGIYNKEMGCTYSADYHKKFENNPRPFGLDKNVIEQ